MARLGRVFVLSIVLLAAACASLPRSGAEPSESARPDPNLLTSEEIANFTNAHQAVQGLRSSWLRRRAPGALQSTGQVWVYRDGVQIGDPDTLRNMSTVEIGVIQYYDGITASQRWGLGHENGVIYVMSRAR